MRAGRRLARAGAVLAVAAGLGALALTVPGPVSAASPSSSATATATATAEASPTTKAASPSGVRLELEQLGPTAVRPSDRVVAKVRVVNTSSTPLDGARVRFFVNSPVLGDRASVQAWADGKGVQGGNRFADVSGAEQVLPAPVPAGGSAEVTITVRAEQLRLASTWGPRGVTIDVLDSSLARVADVRTFLVWTPSGTPKQSTTLTLVSALSGGAPDAASGQLPGERLAELTAPGGRLARVLASTAGTSAALALDPALLGSPATGATGAAGTTGTTPDLDGWLAALRSTSSGQQVLALPLDDPDAVALSASAGGASLYRLAEARGAQRVQSVLSAPASADVAWPVGTGADGDLLGLLQASGRTAVVLPSTGLGSATPASKGGSVPARLTLGAGDDGRPAMVGLVYDASMSATLQAGSTAASAAAATGAAVPASRSGSASGSASAPGPGPGPVDVTTPAVAVARLLADSAVTARTGGAAPALLLATPRDWDPDPVTATAEIGALRTAPWVRSLPLSELRTAASTGTVHLPEHAAAPPGALASEGITWAAKALERADALSGMLTDPAAQRSALQESAVASVSAAWRGDPSGWQERLRALGSSVDALAGGVQVVKGSSVTVISSRVSLPVTLQNTLKQPVRVTVQLKPADLRLRAEGGPRTVTLGANSQRALTLPVRALASGNTRLSIVLATPGGEQVGTPIQLAVRVRADWEGRGVAAAAVVLAAVLLIGFVRTARRVRRRPAPGPAEPGTGPSGSPAPALDEAPGPAAPGPAAPGPAAPGPAAAPPAAPGPAADTTTGSRRAARAAALSRGARDSQPAGRGRRG